MLYLLVAGARPNFMKIAPICRAFADRAPAAGALLPHTGHHYSRAMSDDFFPDLDTPEPDLHLPLVSRTPAQHTPQLMVQF